MERMFRLLRADEIECRISTINDKGLTLLLYKDARVDQNILDETVGPMRWQRTHELINGNLFCNVGIAFLIDGGLQWVWKQDVGTESYTEKEKGQASDSFKRACFNWGIGRELYTAPFIWIPSKSFKSTTRNGKPSTYDRFVVKEIAYDANGKISYLQIMNHSNNDAVVYTFDERKASTRKKNNTESEQQSSEKKETSIDPNQKITKKQCINLKMMCKTHEMPESNIYGRYNHKSMDEMTIADWVDFGHNGQKILKEWDEKKAEAAK